MQTISTLATGVVCCGVLFFAFCVGLVLWYLVRQKPQIEAAQAPKPPIQETIEHPTAGTPESETAETPGADV
jgi:hypothetical protein